MLRETYNKKIVPALSEKLGLKSRMAVPKPTAISLNIGMTVGQLKEPKFVESAESVLERISGQKPVKTLAKKSIASFKIREGMVIGLKVTLRGERMWSFLEKLINVTLPRIRDFQGVADTVVDKQGNLSIGFREHVAFPEIRSDEVERVHGLQVTVTTNAGTRAKGLELFRQMGFPFRA